MSTAGSSPNAPARRPVKLIGIPTDINSSYLRGPAQAPALIRVTLFSDRSNLAAENGLELGRDIPFSDAGDLPICEDASDDHVIKDAVKEAALSGHIPLCLGGDHSISFPIVGALAEIHGPLNILHIDAHPDLYDEFLGNKRSHACPFARILEAGACNSLVQIGIRTLNAHQKSQALRWDVQQISPRCFGEETVPVMASPTYISIDLDGIDPSEAPGVSHPEPGGLTVREVITAIHQQKGKLVGADIVELNPFRDVGGITAAVAAKLAKEICSYGGAA